MRAISRLGIIKTSSLDSYNNRTKPKEFPPDGNKFGETKILEGVTVFSKPKKILKEQKNKNRIGILLTAILVITVYVFRKKLFKL